MPRIHAEKRRVFNLRVFAEICGTVFLLLVTFAAHAQAQEQEDVVKVKSNLVNIDVIVEDKGKQLIRPSAACDEVL